MQQKVPNKTQMRRYLSKGLTQQQIADAWSEETGERVSRSAIAMAISRYELKNKNARPRYEDVMPWTVRTEHQNNHNARMLRLHGRRTAGHKLTEQEDRWLSGFLTKLKERDAVVFYSPDLPEGFVWVKRLPSDGDSLVRKELMPVQGKRSPKRAPARKSA